MLIDFLASHDKINILLLRTQTTPWNLVTHMQRLMRCNLKDYAGGTILSSSIIFFSYLNK